jgi:autotransporter-associated beta strand protein
MNTVKGTPSGVLSAKSDSRQRTKNNIKILSIAAMGVVGGMLAHSTTAQAVTTYSWTNGDTTSLWNSASGTLAWRNTTSYPNAAGVIAEGPTGSGNSGTANLNLNVTVGELKPGTASGGAGWQVVGTSNTITMDGTGLGTNDFGDANVAEIRDSSSTGTFAINTNLSMFNTNLDIGWSSTLDTNAMTIGTLNTTTLNSAGSTSSSTTPLTLNLESNTKGGNASPSIIINSAIGSAGAPINIADSSGGAGYVEFLGAIGSKVTTVANTGTTRLFLGNTGNAYTGDTSVNAGGIINIGKGFNSSGVGQVIPYGAGAGNLVINGTLEMAGNSEQVNALNGTNTGGVITFTSWDGFVGGGTSTLTFGNNNASGTYAGKFSQTTSGRILNFAKVGTGTETLTTGSNVVGAVTVSAGTLQIGDGTAATATVGNTFAGAPVSVADNGNLAFDYNGAVTVANTITGSGSVSQIGSAALTLSSAANTFSGGLNISSSSVIAGNANTGVLGSGLVTMSASTTLDLGGFSPATGLLSASASTPIITNSGGAASVLTIGGTTNQTFAGVIQDGPSFNVGLTKTGAGFQTLTGSNTYSGNTTISAGKLILPTGSSLGNTAISVATGSILAIKPAGTFVNAGSLASGTLGATLNLMPGTGTNPGGIFDMTDGTTGVFNLNQQTGFSGTALTLGGSGTSTNAPTLVFELGSSATDQLNVSTGAVSIGATGANVTIATLAGLTSVTTGNYVLINAPGGGLSPLTLTSNSFVLGTNAYSLSLASSTATQEILSITQNTTTPLNAYWTGAAGTSWSSTGPTNFATTNAGTTPAVGIPGGGSNVFMTADGASSSNLSTTLDGPFTINSLTFTGTGTTAASTSVTVAPGSGGSLTLGADAAFNSTSGGITKVYGAGIGLVVEAGSAAHTVSAPITLGSSQTWEVDNSSTAPFTVSSIISDATFGYSLTKTGVGTLILSGVNTYSGGTTISAGTLSTGAVGALPAAAPVTINGGTLDLAGNNQSIGTLSDGGVSTGSIINSGAAATLTATVSGTSTYSGAITMSGSTFAAAGTGTLSLNGTNSLANLTSAATSLNINGANTIATAVSITGGTTTLGSTGSILGGTAASLTVGPNGNFTSNGGTITVASFTTNSTGTSATKINSGTVTISGPLNIDNDNGAGGSSYFLLAGGSVSASSIQIGRTGLSGGNAILTSGQTGEGLYITGGTLNDSGTLSLGTNTATNSNAFARMDGGTFNVSGAVIITDYGNTRYGLLDVNGGTFTAPTIQMGGNAGTTLGQTGELLVRGTGVVNVGQLIFGNSAQVSGNGVLELLGGTTYVGAGGIVNNSTITPVINFGGTTYATAPILAASAPWSSGLGITLTNSNTASSPVIQTANASGGAVNITLTGFLTGTGGLTKTGAGTLTLTAPNSYAGITSINAGTLNINGQFALGGAVYGGTTFNGGTLQYATSFSGNGTGDITENSGGTAKPVTISAGGATIDLNGNAVTFAGPLGNGGAGGLTLTGGSTLSLSNSSTYTGPTVITGGSTLLAGVANALAPASAFNVSSGVLDASGFNNSIGALTIGKTALATGQLNLGYSSVLNIAPSLSTGILTLGTGSILSLPTGLTPASLPDTLINYNSVSGTFASVLNLPAGDTLQYLANSLVISQIPTGPANLTWNNTGAGTAGNGTTWDGTQLNFNNGTGVVAYSNTSASTTPPAGDNVSFTDTNNGNYSVAITSVVNPTSTTINNSLGAYTFTGAGIRGSGGLTKLGTNALALNEPNSYTGATNLSGGVTTLGNIYALPAGTNLIVSGTGTSLVASTIGNAYALQVGSLNVSSGATIDLQNNAMIVHSGTLTAVSNLATSGYNGGHWNGSTGVSALVSSTATTAGGRLTALGVIVNDASGAAGTSPLYGTSGGIASTFGGATPVDGDILVKYTYYGDTNLSGVVDGNDYSRIDSTYLSEQSTHSNISGWYNGDFNYDGVVDGSDYTLMDNAYNSQGAAIASAIATPTAEIASAATSAVPEPTVLGLLGIGAIGLLGRRNRRSR